MLLLLACGAPDNAWVVHEQAPRELEPIDTVIFTEGPFYDLGERAELLLTSGRPSCETFAESTDSLLAEQGSTLYADEGLYVTLSALTWDGDDAPEPFEQNAWEGTWTRTTYTPTRQVTVAPWVFHDSQLTALPASSFLLTFDEVDGARAIGHLESDWYSVTFEADHCGTMTTYGIGE